MQERFLLQLNIEQMRKSTGSSSECLLAWGMKLDSMVFREVQYNMLKCGAREENKFKPASLDRF